MNNVIAILAVVLFVLLILSVRKNTKLINALKQNQNELKELKSVTQELHSQLEKAIVALKDAQNFNKNLLINHSKLKFENFRLKREHNENIDTK